MELFSAIILQHTYRYQLSKYHDTKFQVHSGLAIAKNVLDKNYLRVFLKNR